VIDLGQRPSEVGSFEIDSPEDLAIAGNSVAVASSSTGLRLIDVGTPRAPVEAGTVPYVDSPYDVAVSGRYAFVTQERGGLGVIDVGLPSDPVPSGSLEPYASVTTGFSGTRVEVSGATAYLVEEDCGFGCTSVLRVIDLSVPATPVEMGSIEFSALATEIAVKGDYAYVSSSQDASNGYKGGLYVIDVSVSSTPVLTGFIELPDALGVAASNNLAVVATESGLHIIDVSTPSAPIEVGFLGVGFCLSINASGGHAYFADLDGFHVIDLSTPTAPVEVGFLEGPGWATGITVGGSRAYLAYWGSGVQVVDITVPSAPIELGFCNAPNDGDPFFGPGTGIAVSHGHVFLAGGRYGLHVLSTYACGKPYHLHDIPSWVAD